VSNVNTKLSICVKSDKGPVPVGFLEICSSNQDAHIAVDIAASADIDNLKSCSKLSGKFSKLNFSVLEQHHSETIEKAAGEFVSRTTQVVESKAESQTKLIVEQTQKKAQTQKLTVQIGKSPVLAECGSFIFESLLARVGFHKEISLDWFDRTGLDYLENLGRVSYRPLPDKTVTALDQTTAMCYGVEKVIERLSTDGNREKLIWHTYHMPDGKGGKGPD